jgi:hypothetical protein
MTSAETEVMLAYLEDRRLHEAADYARRGRANERKSAEELEQEWLAGFRAWAESSARHKVFDRRSLNDLEFEMYLRRLQPPFDLVKNEIEALRVAQDRRFKWLAHDPEAFVSLHSRMGEAIGNFVRGVLTGKKN